MSITEAPGQPGKRPSWWAQSVAAVHGRLWWTRAVTLGVRAIVLDGAGRVLLVRHTYTPGWYLPGGGVDRGESAEAAAVREVLEETGVRCAGRPALHGLFLNSALRCDHVACYIVRHATLGAVPAPDGEIAESGFFPLDALPTGTTAATRRRLDEVLRGLPASETW